MRRTAITAAVVAGMLALGGAVYAGGWGRWSCWGPVRMSPEQRAAWSQYLNDTLQLRQQLVAKRMELRAVMAQPSPDQARVEQLSKEIGELQGKLAVHRLRLRQRLGWEPGAGGAMGLGPCGGGMGPRGGRWR